jgi:sugar phosphate isomerase/epimerase
MMLKSKLAAQLFTLRNELKQDFIYTLRELKKMGWSAVQIDGLHGHDPKEIAAVMKELGLKAAGMHVGLDRMMNDLDAVINEADLFQTPDLICHSLPDAKKNVDGYVSVRRDLRLVSSKVSPKGYRVGFHNHDWEFHTVVDGQIALNYLLEWNEEYPIYAEIDTYWVKKAELDPMTVIEQYSNQMPIIHLKDMTADETKYFTEIGSGIIDFAPIIRWGEKQGVQWYAVEQDYCPGAPMDSLEISYNYLTNLVLDI